jgi:hypothetical protein
MALIISLQLKSMSYFFNTNPEILPDRIGEEFNRIDIYILVGDKTVIMENQNRK